MIGTTALLANRYWLDQLVMPHLTRQAWRARDLATGRTVTVWRPETSSAATAECFLAAAGRTAQIRHPAIARILDFGVADPDGLPFAVAEPADGTPLAAIMQAGPLDPPWILDIIRQVASALSEVQGSGLRLAVNPWSLRLAPGGAVKVAGFDLRQEAGCLADSPSDNLYRLGLVAWGCLTGQLPAVSAWQDEAPARDARQAPPTLSPLPDTVPAGIATLAADLTAAGSAARRADTAHVLAQCGELLTAPMRPRQPAKTSCPGGISLLDAPESLGLSACPEVQVAAVQPLVYPRAVRLVRDGRAVTQPGQPGLRLVDRVEDFGQRSFPLADRAQVGAVRFRHRQRDPARGQQFHALQAEPEGVHRVLGVIAVHRDELWAVGVRPGLAGHGRLLSAQVAEEADGGQPGDEPIGVRDQFGARLVAEHDLLVRHEQHQQDRRVPV